MKKRKNKKLPIHKRFLLNPLVVFLLLCFGVALIGVTIKVAAISIGVSARIPAPLPPTPSVVQEVAPASNPSEQKAVNSGNSPGEAIFTNFKQIILTGDCPKASHVEVYRNSEFAGAAPCIGDPTFSVTIDLVQGLNRLEVHTFNITDDEGPLGSPIYLDYSPPPGVPPSNESAISQGSNQFILTTDFQYLGFLVGNQATWTIDIHGGVTPYSFRVTWGDGQTTTYSKIGGNSVTISHKYKKPSDRNGYIISIEGTDATGETAILNLYTIISTPNSYQASEINVANATRHLSDMARLRHWLAMAWPVYIILLLMMVSFWLGEREEYSVLRRRWHLPGRRATRKKR